MTNIRLGGNRIRLMIRPHFFMIQQQWTYKLFDEAMAKSITDEFNLPPIIAKIMALRGIVNREQSRHFFFPDQLYFTLLLFLDG